MKKNLGEALPTSLFIWFIVVQLVMFFVSVLFAGGGHGTSIPLLMFYGPLLIFLQAVVFENNPTLHFFILFLVLFGFFIGIWLKFVNRRTLKYIATIYILTSVGMLTYTEYTSTGLGTSKISFHVKLLATFISTIISFAMWRIFFSLESFSDDKHL